MRVFDNKKLSVYNGNLKLQSTTYMNVHISLWLEKFVLLHDRLLSVRWSGSCNSQHVDLS